MAKFLEMEEFYFLTLAGLGHAYWYSGETQKTREIGETLLEQSQKISNIRGIVLGHYILGCSHFMSGDFISASEYYKSSIRLSADPYYSQWPRMILCLVSVMNGQYHEAEELLQEVLNYTRKFGVEIIGTPANSIMGIVLVGKGNLSKGIKIYERDRHSYMKKERRYCYALSEYILGTIYLGIIKGEGPRSISFMLRNIVFLLKNLPFLNKKAEFHLKQSIKIAEEIGAKLIYGMAYLNLGLLHQSKRRTANARECVLEAIDVFERCEADQYLKQANEALASLD
jgi:tetratricopeptide (TPR) repeat protein